MKLYQVENFLIVFFQVAIAALVLGIVAHFAVNAWIQEDIARVQPARPTGARLAPDQPSEPKTRVFQDAGRETTTGMGYDARRADRGRR